jgi:hypothetical protein
MGLVEDATVEINSTKGHTLLESADSMRLNPKRKTDLTGNEIEYQTPYRSLSRRWRGSTTKERQHDASKCAAHDQVDSQEGALGHPLPPVLPPSTKSLRWMKHAMDGYSLLFRLPFKSLSSSPEIWSPRRCSSVRGFG